MGGTEGRGPLAIFIMGPTASGKTDLAIELCQHLPCDLISVDSAMIYRGMDIGTAKPSAEELARAPHRLIDICDPSEAYSAADFRRDALREMAEITAAGRIPLLVGGTMMYYKALLQGMGDLPPADPAVRYRLEAEAAEQGWGELHRRLGTVDPVAAGLIHANNRQRLLRALKCSRSADARSLPSGRMRKILRITRIRRNGRQTPTISYRILWSSSHCRQRSVTSSMSAYVSAFWPCWNRALWMK